MPQKLAGMVKSTPTPTSPVYCQSSPASWQALVVPTIPAEAATSWRHTGKADTTNPQCLGFKAVLPVGSYQAQLFWGWQQNQREATALSGLSIRLILFWNSHSPGWSFKHFWRFLLSLNRNSCSSQSWAQLPALLWNLSPCIDVSKREGQGQLPWA